ncbi:MAG: hypothetical protein AAB408_00940 [Patescibacteria group bacterium]
MPNIESEVPIPEMRKIKSTETEGRNDTNGHQAYIPKAEIGRFKGTFQEQIDAYRKSKKTLDAIRIEDPIETPDHS